MTDIIRRRLRIAMISDFFLPTAGGVEIHQYSVAAELIKRGHKVIIITHSRTSGPHHPRIGIRYLNPLLKIYYLPILPLASEATLPQYLTNLPYLRNILIRERIEILHGHGTLSSMALEGLMMAGMFTFEEEVDGVKRERMLRTVFTDHSLFGFDDAVGILTNKLLAGALRNIDAVICVSHAGRENTALRAQLDPSLISVIPNAIVPPNFRPDPSKADPDYITIVTVTRLVYRKGIDLLVTATPIICQKYPKVRFVVGGDGPKMVELEQMREQYLLQERVELLGNIPPSDVPSVLNRGQIYLSTSLTEAFGTSIIEAACTGLFVVSTKVGGVPEIMPRDKIEFATPTTEDVVRALSNAIETIKSGSHNPQRAHEQLKGMYAWEDIAERTERVYMKALEREERDVFERMSRYLDLGRIFGPILCIIFAVQHIWLGVLGLLQPREGIDVVPDVLYKIP